MLASPGASLERPVLLRADTGASREHELALLVSSRCRRCAERLPGGAALRGLACPRCGAASTYTSADRILVDELFRERATQRLWVAVVLAAAATLVTGALPLVSSLVLAVAAAWVSVTIVRPAARLLSVRRRILAVWTWRVGAGIYVALNVVVVELLTLIPILGAGMKAIGAAINVAVLGLLARKYFGWQTSREARSLPIRSGEYVLLAFAGLSVVGGMIAAFSVAAWVLAQLSALVVRVMELAS